MPSATPKRDESTGWPLHEPCGHRHLPGADCPTTGEWLVETAGARRDVAVRRPARPRVVRP